jgi:uncharacterized protein YkwD
VLAADLPANDHHAAAFASANRLERAIVRVVNSARRQSGLPRLRMSRELTRIAASHARDLAGIDALSHASSDGTSFASRVRTVTQARAIGETLASMPAGDQGSALSIVRAWLDSPPHRHELLSRRFSRIGVAKAEGPRASVITADFASGS